MTNTKPETIHKPKYNGSMRFAMLLYPVWVGLFVYYLYQLIVTHSYSPQGILTVVFGIMAFSLPFRVFRNLEVKSLYKKQENPYHRRFAHRAHGVFLRFSQ
jgi:hypothetical protein